MATTTAKTTSPKPAKAAEPTTWERLTAPFPEDWIEKLPKPVRSRDEDRGRCDSSRYSADGYLCGKYHARSVHLDYVGHAGITMRLNDVLGPGGWDFQPMATTPEGLPIITRDAFWAKLTLRVDGEEVTKWELAANFSSAQEALGDALRRCAMRFGIGTYLWSKSDHAALLALGSEPDPEPAPQAQPEPTPQVGPGEPIHVTDTRVLLNSTTQEERATLTPWWDQAVAQGQLPPRTNLEAITPAQAVWVRDTIAAIRDRAQQEAARAAQEAQQTAEAPDPQ